MSAADDDGAFSTIYGGATLSYFQVWAYQVARGTVGVGDAPNFPQRLDNRWTVQTEEPYALDSRRGKVAAGCCRRQSVP